MDCVNHIGVSATAYCQNCGKALCAGCVRSAAAGQILCEPCWMAWQSLQQPFVTPRAGGEPNPAVAAVLGLIPGVGAMYNGQFVKGLIHVVIFTVLVSAAHLYGVFGLLIAGWIFYQSFEAYHTAKALRDGEPLPDPLGLNEAGNWLNQGARPRYPRPPAPGPAQPPSGPDPEVGQATYYPPPPAAEPYQSTYQGPYQAPFTPPAPGFGVPPIPPVPPCPPCGWRRREPIGAVILIALGLLFLLGQLDIFEGRIFEFAWPVLLIGLGIWLVVRRPGNSQGVSK
jgi:TM2 domain-containing membrane protein YozV